MSPENQPRLTRRRSSAGPVPPRRPLGGNGSQIDHRQGPRPTFLTLRDHGKVYVADLPNLSDGQLAHIFKEAEEVLKNDFEARSTGYPVVLEHIGDVYSAKNMDKEASFYFRRAFKLYKEKPKRLEVEKKLKEVDKNS